MKREFTVVIERDEDGYFVGTVTQLKGCHTQAKSLDELMNRIKEAVRCVLRPRANLKKANSSLSGFRELRYDKATHH